MADAGNGRLKYIGVTGLIVCACLAGYLRQRPAPPPSTASRLIDGGYLQPAAMVDAWSPEGKEQTAAVDHRPVRSLFGMETEPVVGALASKWHAVELEIDHEEMVLAGCREQKPCPEPARELLNIIAEGRGRTDRARIGLINRAVDLAITPTADEAQWGVEDHWSSPLETLQTHRGDCEDYAIIKYVALREAGLSSADVKIVILRKLFPSGDHAVAAARVNGEWLILDNRQLTLVRDTDMMRATPKFQLDEGGVHRFVPSGHTVHSPTASL
jgi:predicted transglutaminase-like cysteine proteinase